MRFVGRAQELEFLEQCYRSDRAQLVVLYGRRRIGKTETLRKFAEDKPCVFYSCAQETDAATLANLSRRLLEYDRGAARYVSVFPSWTAAFEVMGSLNMPGKKLVIIDEFPYACEANKTLPSLLQNAWDTTLQHDNVMIVLCGSSMSFMEGELLGAKNPLYGRATGVWKMEPLGYEEACAFFPDYAPQQKLEAYGILGGVPHYLRQFDPAKDVTQNVCDAILTRGCALYNEVDFLMRQELREPAVYNTILGAVATGETALNGIAQRALLDARTVSTYLSRLSELGIVERELSVGTGEQERNKPHRGLWRVSDSYFKFWFAVVRPNLSELDVGDAEGVWRYAIRPRLNDLLSWSFEEVCRQWVRRRNVAGELPFRYRSMGRWWQGSEEIDIVAIGDGGKRLLGECKFRSGCVGRDVLETLQAKRERRFSSGTSWLYLFAKEGFAESLSSNTPERVRLVQPEELER